LPAKIISKSAWAYSLTVLLGSTVEWGTVMSTRHVSIEHSRLISAFIKEVAFNVRLLSEALAGARPIVDDDRSSSSYLFTLKHLQFIFKLYFFQINQT